MKKTFITLLSLVTFATITFAQNISFTIKPGGDEVSAKAYYTSNASMTGVVSQILVTFTLPQTVAASAPSATFTTNASFPQWGALTLNTPSIETVNGVSSYVYTFFAAPATSTNTVITNGEEVLLGEVSFAAGTNITDLKLANLPDGGSSGISFLLIEVGGEAKSNPTSLTYGTGAVNSPDGFSGLSYVPLPTSLPVKFLSFYALKSGDAGKLTWTVNDDANNEYFDVERSMDGKEYRAVSRVNAMKNGSAINTYTSLDPVLSKLGSKVLYYRIKQLDKNGTTTYSAVRLLNVDAQSAMSIYPNPARTVAKLVVDAPQAGKAAIIVRDNQGRQLQLINTQLVRGINQKDINVTGLPSGEYHVSVVSDNLNQSAKLTKVN